MGPCASHPIDSTIRAQGPRWKSIAALLVGGDTGWSDGLLHAVRSRVRLLRRLQARPAPFQTQHPKRDPCPFQTLRPEAHWRAWIDASSDRAPLNVALPGVTHALPLQTLRPQTRPFPKRGLSPNVARAPFQTLSTLPQMLSMPLSKHRMCPLCVIGFQKCVGFIGDPAACASFSSSLSGVLRSRSALYITPVR